MVIRTTLFAAAVFIPGLLLKQGRNLPLTGSAFLSRAGSFAVLVVLPLLLDHRLHPAWWLVLLELSVLSLGLTLRWMIRPPDDQVARHGRQKARRVSALATLIPAATIIAVVVWKVIPLGVAAQMMGVVGISLMLLAIVVFSWLLQRAQV